MRVFLLALGAAWALVQWLRLVTLWSQGSPFIAAGPDDHHTAAATLCRVYLTVSIGCLEPMFLLCTLFLARAALSKARQTVMWRNAWIVAAAVVGSLPALFGQTLIAWMGVIFPTRTWEQHPHSVPHYFLSPYLNAPQPQMECDTTAGIPTQARCVRCIQVALVAVVLTMLVILPMHETFSMKKCERCAAWAQSQAAIRSTAEAFKGYRERPDHPSKTLMESASDASMYTPKSIVTPTGANETRPPVGLNSPDRSCQIMSDLARGP
ncbi:hypothetical protein WJX73_009903 [Symbiochloris irregularis]|uniref:Uncharacterized protein n=1 Tax=Symbiochloris irregularis TaxID=706552 RepID=A0AAW1NNY1_9CHLO